MTKIQRERLIRLSSRLAGLGFSANEIDRLLVIERSLGRSAEARCNVDEDEAAQARRDKREARLENEAQHIAHEHGCRAYFQGDPRGCALYILRGNEPNPERPDRSYYSSDGIAVCID